MSESTFATLDLVPLLLQVLNDPSTYPTLRDLVIYYFEGSHGQSLAASLRVCNSKAPTFGRLYRLRVGGFALQVPR